MYTSAGAMDSDEKLVYDQIKDSGNQGKLRHVLFDLAIQFLITHLACRFW